MIRAATALAIALSACVGLSAEEPGVSAHEILIGSCSSLSGDNKFNGQQTVAGARAFLEEVNAGGGVRGRKIRLLSLDHKYDADEAIDCFKKLMDQDIFAAAFINGSPALAKMVPMAQTAKIPMIGFYAGAQFLYSPVHRYVFAVKPSFEDEVAFAVGRLWKDRGIRRIGVIYQADAAGAPFLQGARVALDYFGGKLSAAGAIDPKRSDGDDSAIAANREANVEAVLICARYQRVDDVLQRAARVGWKPLFVTCSASGDEELVRKAGKAAEGIVILSPVPTLDRTGLRVVDRFLHAMKKYEPKESKSLVSLEGYVDAVTLVEGLKRAGASPTREGLVDALESIREFDAGLGPDHLLNYRPESHRGLDAIFFTVVRGGKLVNFSDWKTLR